MKYCEDCKHSFIPAGSKVEHSRCLVAPKVKSDNRFIARSLDAEHSMFCSTARISEKNCGPDGKLFEQKDVA